MSTSAEPRPAPDAPQDGRGRVVVGVDGSPGSRAALRAAILAADIRGDAVQVVTAPLSAAEIGAWGTGAWPAVPLPDPDQILASAQHAAREMVDDLLAELHGRLRSAPDIEVRAVVGEPGRVLVEAARGADRLVVGHRGRGAVGSLVLGSVGLHCLAHPPCPVTIVPSPDGGG
ncbi:universal stress protein [Actinomycetospora lemnae]|uniref:Universal stress protein n=1 Tax=Actinomycetospora lemnae TaxID=3019891 RepID=A0ABT5SYQ3_9PSEU|nr:universal stress protein [Actinomycetospora sp. DW7H6]MDD7967991.1 universal stress protein [Actinomycetospora sp. DW7H6]